MASDSKSQSQGAWQLLLRSCRQRSDWPSNTRLRCKKACKYLWRSLTHPQLQARWLRFLYTTPLMRQLLCLEPRMHELWQRHYINTGFSKRRRNMLVIAHYRYVLEYWSVGLFEAVHLRGGATLGRFTLKDDSQCELRLERPCGEREGELALSLFNAQAQRLSTVTVTLVSSERRLLIGCVQGAASDLGRDAVSGFTRAAHGLRPKNLLLSLCYVLAAEQGMDWTLHGIAQERHPFGDEFEADYNRFWLESGGELGKDGFFALPHPELRRDESQVASKHRGAFRRREALRQEICARLVQVLRQGSSAAESAAEGADEFRQQWIHRAQ